MDTPLEDPPRGMRELRLTMRVLNHWRDLTHTRAFPRMSDIDPKVLGRDWASCLQIHATPAADRSRFIFVGESLCDPREARFEGRYISECLPNTVLHKATAYIARVLDKRVPISMGGAAIHHGAPILYRSVLMPLSENGTDIDGLFGAANYREIPAADQAHLSPIHG